MNPRWGRGLRGQGERGQASVELLGMLPWLLLIALVVWQLMIIGYTAVSTGNAARTAGRVESLGGDGEKAGVEALPGVLAGDAKVEIDGEEATVSTPIPLLLPGVSASDLAISKSATFPSAS